MNRAQCQLVRIQKNFFSALLVFFLHSQMASAQYGGVLVHATPETPLAVGQALNISLVVSNNTTNVWQTGGDMTFSWAAEAYNASWNSNLDSTCFSYATIPPGGLDTMTITLDGTNLPSAPGAYSLKLATAYNWYTGLLSFMDGSPQTLSFTIVSNAINHAPIIAPISDGNASEGSLFTLQVTAVDTDTPPQTLMFSLGAGAPFVATINPTSGLFSWTPLIGAPRTNKVSVIVRDNGLPPMMATNTFKIYVGATLRFLPPTEPANGLLRLSWQSVSGKHYRLTYRDTVASGAWTNLSPDILATGSATSVTNQMSSPKARFYRLQQLD